MGPSKKDCARYYCRGWKERRRRGRRRRREKVNRDDECFHVLWRKKVRKPSQWSALTYLHGELGEEVSFVFSFVVLCGVTALPILLIPSCQPALNSDVTNSNQEWTSRKEEQKEKGSHNPRRTPPPKKTKQEEKLTCTAYCSANSAARSPHASETTT